jgi:ABC-2 type transport system ATP-binding protein
LLGKLGIPLQRRISRRSRGEKVKLALLLAMAFRPRLLILDEPFAGLDPLVRAEFLDSVLEITRQNDWSIFFSTHDIDDVEKLAEPVIFRKSCWRNLADTCNPWPAWSHSRTHFPTRMPALSRMR